MIDAAYVQRMARYNRWQNESLYAASDALSEDERRRERGAFFGSIHKTLSHLIWADRIWMSRFAGAPRPEGGIPQSVTHYPDWEELKRARTQFDGVIIDWADRVDATWLAGDHTWFSGARNQEVTRPAWSLVAHFFNHQTHHRGQVHCMITQAGGKPDPTDLMIMPMQT